MPHVARVVAVTSIDEGVLGVVLDSSHARHVIRATSPDAVELERVARSALERGTVMVVTESSGLSPRKVWIQGNLYVNTKNNPNCHVWWGWHVAPTLCVRGPMPFQSQRMVIDPSLFTTPVTKTAWKGVQGDPTATLTDSDASDYFWGSTDPAYVDTNKQLAFYRLQLHNRSLQYGPPPYANCP